MFYFSMLSINYAILLSSSACCAARGAGCGSGKCGLWTLRRRYNKREGCVCDKKPLAEAIAEFW